MEQHPVPQNVTTFQFRLIGDMTIKQFGYLAGGVILAYVSYKLPLPFFFTWPLTVIFAVGGFGFAFVPVEERPMDVWVLSFLKSIYSPTQFVWQKTVPVATAPAPQPKPFISAPIRAPQPMPQAPAAQPQLKIGRSAAEILGGVFSTQTPGGIAPPAQSQPAPHPQKNMFDWISDMLFPRAQPQGKTAGVMHAAPSVPMPSVTGRHMDISMPPAVTAAAPKSLIEAQKKEEVLETKLHDLKAELENKSMTEARILELQKQLTEVIAQKDKMETEVIALRKQAAAPAPAPAVTTPAPQVQPQAAPSHVATPQIPKAPTVKIITPEGAVKAGLPRLTTFPNVVTGIIKDNENNFLPGVLITVKDREGIPLRALKTNRLGQFAASTPLANGVYFVEVEDPRIRYTFDRIQITLNGSIVPALEIIAKSQKEITRDKLTKELFGDTSR